MNDVSVSTGRGARRFAGLFQTFNPAALACLAAVLALLRPATSLAVPYASSLSNNAGTISFRLNEAANGVAVISGGGATINNLGALPAGLHSFELGVSGPYRISVFKAGAIGFTAPVAPNRGAILQISPNTGPTRFNNPRGLVVNTDPASPYFGRIYVANGQAGATTAGPFGPARTVGDGVYLLNSDFTDAIGQGDTALTAGISFVAGTDTASPYRLTLGPDANVYITDWSDANGSLYVADPDLSAGSGFNVLGGPVGSPFPVTETRFHGSIAAAAIEGTLAGDDLAVYVIDEDLQNDRTSTTQNMRNTLWKHEIGSTLPGPEQLPTRVGSSTPWINFASQTMDMSRGTNGYFYVNNYRSTGSDRGGVYVLDPEGNVLWNSLAASRELLGDTAANDLLRATGGGAVSPLGDYIAVINLESNGITVVPLIEGIPDLTNRLVFHGFNVATAQGRDVAFDAVGNLYAISSGAQSLRAFSPGGTTTVNTYSDGTLEIIRPPNAVSVTSADTSALESGPDTGTFTITRTGDTAADLTVSYTLTGTAGNGTDYQTIPLTTVIPAGSPSVDIVVTPIDDTDTEAAESVTLTLVSTSNYDVRAPVAATVSIADNEQALINISVIDNQAYERHSQDAMTFRVDRLGETNSELFVLYEPNAGTAIHQADFTGADGQPLGGTVLLLPGQTTATISVVPIDDSDLEGNETVGIQITPGLDPYTPGTPDTAFATLVDNELPPAAVLFSDDLDNDTSANWTVRFGANNGIYDADIRWAFDYSTLTPPIPPAPNSPGTTRGVFLQVNRTNSAANGTAGVNLYPGRTFSGNFALRADMYLSYDVSPAGSTEHALLGLNHSGLLTNRATITTADANGNARGGDGVWAAIGTDGSNTRDWSAYIATNASTVPGLYTNRSAASVATLLSAPPYAIAGSPGNRSASQTKTWAEVELGQSNNVITLKVNNSVVYSFPNPSGFTSGDIMIGHNDQADSIGSQTNYVIFDNVRVVTFDTRITSVQLLEGNQVQIDFVSPGQESDFRLESTAAFSPTDWNVENTAVISTTAQGFRFVVTRAGDTRFYQIRR